MKRRILTLILLAIVLSLSLLVLQPTIGNSDSFASPRPSKVRPHLVNFDKLPLAFEPNRGQADPRVKFLARGKGYGILVSDQEVVLKLASGEGVPKPSPSKKIPANSSSTSLRLKLEGAQSSPSFAGTEKLSGVSHYFVGNDRSKWLKDVPQFAKITAQGTYPGMDMVYYGNQRKLEYDLVVHPGADPKAVRLSIEGARSIRVNDGGDVELETGHGKVFLRSPQVYQDDPGGRTKRTARYRLKEGNKVAFDVDDYDRTKPLVIDPVLDYSTYLGGSSIDAGYGIAVDGSGNAYVTGNASSLDFPTTTGAYQTSLPGGSFGNAFISKINAAGTSLVYSTYLGGSIYDSAQGIAVDGSGDAYVAGYTFSDDFPTQSAIQAVNNNSSAGNAFVTELDPTGASLVFSTYLGGTGTAGNGDYGWSIAVNGTGIYVTGWSFSSDFPMMSPIQAVNKNTTYGNVFVSKINTGGGSLAYSTYLGGTGNGVNEADEPFGIAVDGSGNAYVTGSTCSSNFPTTAGAFQTTHGVDGGREDVFITKVNSAGTTWAYSTYLGGNWYDRAYGIAVDAAGDAFVTGYVGSNNFPVTHAIQPARNANYDAFVAELNPSGSALVYSTYLGGSGADYASAIAIDSGGDAFITGNTRSSDFPVTQAVQAVNNDTTNANVFVADIASTGPSTYQLYFSTYFGGSGGSSGAYGDGGNAIAVRNGDIYVTGFTNSYDLTTTTGAPQTTMGGVGAQNGLVFDIGINTPTSTFTNTATNTATMTPTNTPTFTFTNTATNTPTITYTNTPTQTPTMTVTATPTNTPTSTNTPIITDVTISAPYPNPVYGSGPLSVNVQAPTGSTFTWSVFSLSFRKVTENTVVIPYNNSTMVWDLKDSKGTSVANGLYYVRMQVNGPVKSSKILKVLILR